MSMSICSLPLVLVCLCVSVCASHLCRQLSQCHPTRRAPAQNVSSGWCCCWHQIKIDLHLCPCLFINPNDNKPEDMYLVEVLSSPRSSHYRISACLSSLSFIPFQLVQSHRLCMFYRHAEPDNISIANSVFLISNPINYPHRMFISCSCDIDCVKLSCLDNTNVIDVLVLLRAYFV